MYIIYHNKQTKTSEVIQALLIPIIYYIYKEYKIKTKNVKVNYYQYVSRNL